jgi:hypothetical protein
MSLKMWRFKVENMRTGETCGFLGQGETMDAAWKEGLKNCTDAFRPSTSGAKRPEHGIGVTTKDGRDVSRTVKEFESDVPYGQEPPGAQPPEIIA